MFIFQKKFQDAQQLLAQKDQEIKDLEVKLFEKSSVITTNDFEEEGPNSVSMNPFDETPLPTSRKTLDFGFNAIGMK